MERAKRFTHAVRRYWVRLTVGALAGVIISTWYLILFLVALEQNYVPYQFIDYADFALVAIMFSTVGGAMFAYTAREN